MTPILDSRPRTRAGVAWLVGLVGMSLIGLSVVRALSQVDWDPTLYTAFGEEAAPTREYAEGLLGEVILRPGQGHDGKFFFVQANDPLVLHPEEQALVLDRPLYRSQRMLYPLVAGAGGLFEPSIIVWSLVVVNVLAMGVGGWVTARLATLMGMSPWWGLAFPLNPGLISEVLISGGGILAALAAFGAVALYLSGRTGWGLALLALAALTREAMLIAAVGTAWWLIHYQVRRREALLALVIPVVAVGSWAAYLRWRIGFESGVGQVEEIGWPFVGFARAMSDWSGDPLNLMAGLATMALFVLYGRRVLASRHLVGWTFLGFVALGLVFTEQVWRSYFNITRAIAPVITAFVFLVFVGRGGDEAVLQAEQPAGHLGGADSGALGDQDEGSL